MKIAVCLKHVPSRDARLRIAADRRWIEERDLSWEINEPDTYALEEALRLREKHGGEVLVVSAGPERVAEALKRGLAMGADRAIHLVGDATDADAHAVAGALAEALRSESPDLVLTGVQSDDKGYAATGVMLAELLGLPHSTLIMEVQVEDGRVRVKREMESGWFQSLELPLPALLTIQSGINQVRYATLKGIMAAKKKPMESRPAQWGPVRLTVQSMALPAERAGGRILGTGPDAVSELVRVLRDEAKVL